MNRVVKKGIPLCVFILAVMMGVMCSAVKIEISDLDVVEHIDIEARLIEFKAKEAQRRFEQSEIYWLTMNIYHESRGEDPLGRLMVALVTLDRQADGRWGDTIKEVVTAPAQFSWYSDGKPDIPSNTESWNQAKRIAVFAKKMYSEMGDFINITHYHSGDVDPKWNDDDVMERVMSVGNHTFYREVTLTE